MWDCPRIQEVWAIFSRVFDSDINWSVIVKGVKGNHYINQLLSLLMYIIYKKFQRERNLNGPIEETRSFVRRELIFRKDHYELCDKIFGILGNIEKTFCKNWSIECANKYLVLFFIFNFKDYNT